MNCPCVCTLKKHFVSVLLQTVTQSADSNHTSQLCLEIQMKNSFFSSQSMAGFFTPIDKIFSRCKKKIFLGRVCACLWAFREVYQHTELHMQEQTQIFPAHFFFPFKNTQLHWTCRLTLTRLSLSEALVWNMFPVKMQQFVESLMSSRTEMTSMQHFVFGLFEAEQRRLSEGCSRA